MATIKGKWLLNSSIDTDTFFSGGVPFTSNGQNFLGFYVVEFPSARFGLEYITPSSDRLQVYYGASGWEDEAYRTVDFGNADVEAYDEFYTWLTTNVTQVEGEYTEGISIVYKDITISAKPGETVVLETNGKLLTENLQVKSLFVDELDVWDGSFTVTDIEEPNEDPIVINFTINGTSYQALEGMTWEEWVNSEYNTDDWYIGDDGLITQNNAAFIDGAYDSDIIINSTTYETTTGGSD